MQGVKIIRLPSLSGSCRTSESTENELPGGISMGEEIFLRGDTGDQEEPGRARGEADSCDKQKYIEVVVPENSCLTDCA